MSVWDFILGRAGREERNRREREARLDGAMAAIHAVIETLNDMPAQKACGPLPELLPYDHQDLNALPIVWKVPLPNQRAVYMGLSRAPAGEEYDRKKHVVIVRARHFYAAWRAADLALNCDTARALLPSDIPKDRKWSDQGPNWAEGRKNPVYLPDVGYHPSRGPAFGDGITRSLWLIYNGAESFPVYLYDEESARGLHRLLGDPRRPPQSVQELWGQVEART